MGQVYKAPRHHPRPRRGLKVMVANIVDDPELKQRFEREARASPG